MHGHLNIKIKYTGLYMSQTSVLNFFLSSVDKTTLQRWTALYIIHFVL